jgi:hypothetical protein
MCIEPGDSRVRPRQGCEVSVPTKVVNNHEHLAPLTGATAIRLRSIHIQLLTELQKWVR